MRMRGSFFWGILLIVLALFLLGRQMGYLPGNVWDYFWPAAVILVGAWLLFGALTRGRFKSESHDLSVPLEGAKSARLKLDHGAGRLHVSGGAGPAELLSGTFGMQAEYRSRRDGDQLDVRVHNDPQFWMWVPGETLDWDIRLNRDVPINLRVDSGASSTVLDLTDLKVTDLDVDTGASSTEISLPANAGSTHVDIDAGAASLVVRIPAGVAARIRVKSGIAATNIDGRFPSLENGLYQSADYATAANRADITIDAGVGSIDIRSV